MLTKLVNERKQDVLVRESDGTPVIDLAPGEKYEVETDNPSAVLAPFSEVRFVDKEPYAYLTPRPDFQPPKRQHPCTFLLVKGQYPTEFAALKSGPLCLMRGVPVTADLALDDNYITYNRVEIGIPVMRRRASVVHDGLVVVEWDFEERCSNRPVEELERIQSGLEELAAKAALESAAASAIARETA